MKVFPEKRALLVRAKHPTALLTVIPTAKLLASNYVAVPHRLDEVRVLTNMGARPPSPMLYYYGWPGLYTPFEAQRHTAAFLSIRPRAYCLNDLGTGKSLSVLWAYDYLRSIGARKRMLVVCPLSTMERVWADEVFRHFMHLSCTVVHGTRDRRRKLLADPADIYIINHDGLEIIAGDLEARDDIDLIVVDELAQVARNSGTDRWKALNAVINKQCAGARWSWGLTGKPTPNAPTDAWAQCKLLTPSSAPPYFRRFRDRVMQQVTTFIWRPRADANDAVREIMQPAIRYGRDECVDLPECMYQTVQSAMTTEQTKAYKEMLTKLKTEVEEGQILAVNEAIKISKLVQIACGVAYDGHGNEITIPSAPRLDLVLEIVEAAAGKVIVFVPFVSTIDHVAEHLRKAGHTVECIHGAVHKNTRDSIFKGFQGAGDPRVLVAQPGAMSHGLTLTQANTIVWYAPITSNEIYEQACARITRPGQKRQQFIVNVEGSPIERKMYARLKDKQTMQGLLLDDVSNVRDSVVANV